MRPLLPLSCRSYSALTSPSSPSHSIVLILLTATWFIDGRVNFRGPSDMDTRLEEAARLSNEEDSQI